MLTRRTFLQSALLLPAAFTHAVQAQDTSATAPAPIPTTTAPDGFQKVASTSTTSIGDTRFEKLCRKYIEFGLPAVWIAVANQGQFLGASCAGFRDVKNQIPAGVLDCVGYGSITKPFTGLMVATLVAEGKMKYSDPVIEYVTDIADAFKDERQKITLGQLVTHMAGFPPGPPEPTEVFTDGTAYRRQFALNGLSMPLQHPVGTTYEYSNIDITIAAYAAERVTQKPWEQLIRERVTMPLKLSSVMPHPAVDDKLVHSYELGPSGLTDTINEKATQRNRFGPAGCLQGTVSDLVRFGLAFLDAERLPPPIPKSGIYPLLVHTAPGSEVSYCAIGSSERPGNAFRLSHAGSLETGRYRAYAHLRINSSQPRAVAVITNTYAYGEDNQYSKRIVDMISQMNDEVESYL